jgi:multidrug efflux pump subunit AcrA (membrane-fusion protein)
MKLRYWIISIVFFLAGLGLVARIYFLPDIRPESKIKTPQHDSPAEPQGHDDHKHAEDEEKEGHDDHEESEEESVGGVGKGNAVTAADEHDGIRLSSKAIEAMGIRTSAYKVGFVPVAALVRYQENTGVYRLRDGWFKLVPVKIKSQQGDSVAVISGDLGPEDQIAVVGTGLLRAAELDAFSTEAGHGH